MPRPREYDDELRTKLIEAAARLLSEEGPHAVSTRRVAAEVGTSTTAIYSLLGRKEELLRAVCLEGFRRLGEHLHAVATGDDPLERLERLRLAYFDNALENPHLYQVMFGIALVDYTPSQDDLDVAWSTFQTLQACVADCIAAGYFTGDALDIALELWAMDHGICLLAIRGMLGTMEEARRHFTRALGAAVTGYRALAGSLASEALPRSR